jgi:hypothetical protein
VLKKGRLLGDEEGTTERHLFATSGIDNGEKGREPLRIWEIIDS